MVFRSPAVKVKMGGGVCSSWDFSPSCFPPALLRHSGLLPLGEKECECQHGGLASSLLGAKFTLEAGYLGSDSFAAGELFFFFFPDFQQYY